MVRLAAPLVLAVSLVVVAVGGRSAPACTGEPMTLRWLADHAALVLVCEIGEVRSRWTVDHARIESEVLLRVLDCLKGDPAEKGEPISLSFPGGTVGDTTMRLCCAPDLRPGQRWIVFLQPEYRTYPTAGMGQGLFRLDTDANGVTRVHSANGLPITEIDARGVPVSTLPPPEPSSPPHRVRGDRLRVRARPLVPRGDAPGAMTLDEFRDAVAPILAASRAHDQAGPVGRYVEPIFIPVPLGVAPGTDQQTDNREPQARTPRPPERREPSRPFDSEQSVTE